MAPLLLIDVQGFKSNNNSFIFKEVAVFNFASGTSTSYLLKPPIPWGILEARYKSENTWLARNYHGLQWDSGDTPYHELHSLLAHLFTSSATIFVKGLEKRKWLQEEFPETVIINVEDHGCPSLQKLKECFTSTTCLHHTIPFASCAIENVLLIKSWLISALCKSDFFFNKY